MRGQACAWVPNWRWAGLGGPLSSSALLHVEHIFFLAIFGPCCRSRAAWSLVCWCRKTRGPPSASTRAPLLWAAQRAACAAASTSSRAPHPQVGQPEVSLAAAAWWIVGSPVWAQIKVATVAAACGCIPAAHCLLQHALRTPLHGQHLPAPLPQHPAAASLAAAALCPAAAAVGRAAASPACRLRCRWCNQPACLQPGDAASERAPEAPSHAHACGCWPACSAALQAGTAPRHLTTCRKRWMPRRPACPAVMAQHSTCPNWLRRRPTQLLRAMSRPC